MVQLLGEPSSNPLSALTAALEVANLHLGAIATNTARPAEHTYALHAAGPDQWLVYCLACSAAQERFVHPCVAQSADAPTPPSSFMVALPS